MIRLTNTWEEFSSKVQKYIDEANRLRKQVPIDYEPILNDQSESKNAKNNAILDRIFNESEQWHKKVLEFLDSSISGNDYFRMMFNSDDNDSWVLKVTDFGLLRNLSEKAHSLDIVLNLLEVCDTIFEKKHSQILEREKLNSEEILDFILSKLYDLYGDFEYPISILLVGNGIPVRTNNEHIEYYELLKKRKLVESFGMTNVDNAKLTLKGKMYVENLRKKSSSDYSSVSNDKEKLFEKLDQILDQAEKANLGNEILNEEMAELKFAYEKLSKKNWGQLLKGKLVDLVIGQVINEDFAKRIFEEVANMPLYLK